MIRKLKLAEIIIDPRLQSRVAMNEEIINEYKELLSNEVVLPPVAVYHCIDRYWLVDGFHRFKAMERTGRAYIPVAILEGTYRDAFLYSRGVNDSHGLRRTVEDKRHAVKSMLDDPECAKWPDREIARQCKVSHTFVAKFRNGDLSGNVARCDESPDSQNEIAPTYIDSQDPQAEGVAAPQVITEHTETKELTATALGDAPEAKSLSVHVDRCDDQKRTVMRSGKTYEQDTSNIGKKSKRKPSPDSDDVEPDMSDEELHGDFDPVAELETALKRIDELEKENERLTAIIATDDATAEIARLTEECRIATLSVHTYMLAANEAKQHAKGQKWRCGKLEQELAELKRQGGSPSNQSVGFDDMPQDDSGDTVSF